MKKSVLFFAVTAIAFALVSSAIAQEGPMTIGSISPDIKLGGYVQARYNWWEEDFKDDTFQLKRALIWIKGDLAEKTSVCITGFLQDGWTLLDAFGSYEVMPELTISAGQFLLPYSAEQLQSSAVRPTLERANVSNALAEPRDVGVKAEGALMDGMFGYGLAVVNGRGWVAQGGAGLTDDNDKKDIVARVWTKPLVNSEGPMAGLMLAGAYQTGEQPWTVATTDPATGASVDTDMGDEKRTRYVGTVACDVDSFTFVGEYLHQELDEQNVTASGYYGTATYDIDVNDLVIQPVVKYEHLDPNDDIDDNEQSIITLGVNTFLNPRSRITLQYQMIDEEPEVDNDYLGAQWQYIF